LTYDYDSLNAFRGILSRFPYISIWGVPIALEQVAEIGSLDEAVCSIRFARGLWWDSPGDPWRDMLGRDEKFVTLRRRIDFPSWSWAGWSGPIRPHIPEHLPHYLEDYRCNKPDQTISSTRFWVDTDDRRQISVFQYIQEAHGKAIPPEASPVLRIEANISKVRIRNYVNRNNPIAYICDCPLEEDCHEHRMRGTVKYNVRLFEDPLENERLRDRVFSQKWDVVELFRCSDGALIPSLIIDWEGDAANVVGFVNLHRVLFADWEHRRRRIIFKLA
jgi:hypothetical protein